MERDTFIFRKKWYEAIKSLDNNTKAAAFDCICQYALYHNTEEPTDPMVRMAMAFIVPELEADCEKWADVKEKRREAINTRWRKVKELQNNTSEYKCIKCNTNDTDNVFSFVNVNVNDFLFSKGHAVPEEKKEEIIFELGKKILLRGYKNAIKEATAFYNHNQSTGWVDGKGHKIQDAFAWLEGWQCNPKNYLEAINESAHEYILFITAAKLTDPNIIDGFRGIQKSGDSVSIYMTKKCAEAIEKSVNDEVLKAKELYFGDAVISYKIEK